MEPLGSATSVFAVVQLGFSVARLVNDYVGAYLDAPDNVQSLGLELSNTSYHLDRLSELIKGNDQTRGWDAVSYTHLTLPTKRIV